MDEIKEAFSRVREDIDYLFNELDSMKSELRKTRESLIEMGDSLIEIKDLLVQQTNQQTDRQTNISHLDNFPTQNSSIPTNPTYNTTDFLDFKALKPQNLGISTGNEGVPTDRQTDQQTNQQTHNSSHNLLNTPKNSFENALEVLDSLDNIKKEIRIKFKRLTDQEMVVFSMLYQLSEEEGYSDYKTLSIKLNLSESSIRDYIGRILNKGIPVEKTKINNKNIQLSVSKDLKKIASLQTIMQLREI